MSCDIGETRVSTHPSVNTVFNLFKEPHSLQEICSNKTERLEIIAKVLSSQNKNISYTDSLEITNK